MNAIFILFYVKISHKLDPNIKEAILPYITTPTDAQQKSNNISKV
jgi:hypothetical protein